MNTHCFKTARLTIDEITQTLSEEALTPLLKQTVNILTPEVVKSLPPYFHGIKSTADAHVWFTRMMKESRLFTITHNSNNAMIGFVFVSEENEHSAHIGYLLDENYWRQGLAKEMLSSFLNWAKNHTPWHKLIGGVDKTNTASSHLLTKLEFVKQPETHPQVNFYQFTVKQ